MDKQTYCTGALDSKDPILKIQNGIKVIKTTLAQYVVILPFFFWFLEWFSLYLLNYYYRRLQMQPFQFFHDVL